MALVTLDDTPVISGTLTLPLTGRFTADVRLNPRGPLRARQGVRLTFQGGATYRATIERAGDVGGFYGCRLVGGTGGLSEDIAERYYQDISAATVLRDLLRDCGEDVGEVDLPGTLTRWVRLAGPAHEALRALLARYPNRYWRTTPVGKIDVGAENWDEHPRTLSIDSEYPERGVYVTQLDPTLTPGLRVKLGREGDSVTKRATRVTHSFGAQLRTEVGTQDGADAGPAGLAAVIRATMRHTDYHALFPGTLLTDHGGHLVDVSVNSPGFPQLVKIPLDVRVPGVTVKVKAGARVIVAFENGDPASPVCEVRDPASLDLIRITDTAGQFVEVNKDANTITVKANATIDIDAPKVNLAGGGMRVARLGDTITATGVDSRGDSVTVTGTITGASSKTFTG